MKLPGWLQRSDPPDPGRLGDCVIQVVWGPRDEDLQTAAQKCAATFALCAGVSPILTQWSGGGRSKKAALRAPLVETTSLDALQKLLLAGRNYTEMPPRTVIPDLGYSISFWNKESEGTPATIAIRCGTYAERLSNVAVVTIDETEARARTTQSQKLELFRGMARIWTAETGRVYRARLDHDATDDGSDRSMVIYAHFGTDRTSSRYGKFELSAGDSQMDVWVNRSVERFF